MFRQIINMVGTVVVCSLLCGIVLSAATLFCAVPANLMGGLVTGRDALAITDSKILHTFLSITGLSLIIFATIAIYRTRKEGWQTWKYIFPSSRS